MCRYKSIFKIFFWQEAVNKTAGPACHLLEICQNVADICQAPYHTCREEIRRRVENTEQRRLPREQSAQSCHEMVEIGRSTSDEFCRSDE